VLSISQSQLQVFDEGADLAFRRRLVVFLRQSFPDDPRLVSDARAGEAVADSVAHASEHGVVGERGVAKWAFLSIATGGAFARLDAVERAFTEGSDPEFTMDLLFDELCRHERLSEKC